MRKEKGNALEICLIIFLILAFIFITVFFFVRFINKNKPGTPTGPNDTTVGSTEVKIDLLGSDNDTSIVGKTIPFIVPEGQTQIVCEPGASYYTEPFFVKNTGGVKVDYLVSISEGTSVEARAFKEAFNFWITTDLSNSTDPTPLYEHRGVLNPGESTPSYYLIISMKPSADDQYQGKTFETVGITITAVEHKSSGQE